MRSAPCELARGIVALKINSTKTLPNTKGIENILYTEEKREISSKPKTGSY